MERVTKIAGHVTAVRGLAAELAELATLYREGVHLNCSSLMCAFVVGKTFSVDMNRRHAHDG